MKSAFFHDVYVAQDGNQFFSSGSLHKGVVSRYVKHFGDLTLVCREDSKSDVKSLSLIGGTDDNLSFRPVPNLASFNLLNIFRAVKVFRNVRSENDLLIVRLPSVVGFIAASVFTYVYGDKKNVLIELVGCPYETYRHLGTLKGKLLAKPLARLTRALVKKAENVSYVTNVSLQASYPSQGVNVIGCSDADIKVDDQVFNRRLSTLEKKSEDQLTIGMIGFLNAKYKGFDLAFKALKEVREATKKNVVLEIVGAGNPEKLKSIAQNEGIENHVNFVGTKSFPGGVFEWLDNIDIYIQPSRSEGMPRSLMEAMSRACCCVGSRVGDIDQLLDEKYVHDVDDHRTLSKILVSLTKIENRIANIKSCFNSIQYHDASVLEAKRSAFFNRVTYGLMQKS